MLKPGDKAPAFRLQSDENKTVSLKDFKRKRVPHRRNWQNSSGLACRQSQGPRRRCPETLGQLLAKPKTAKQASLPVPFPVHHAETDETHPAPEAARLPDRCFFWNPCPFGPFHAVLFARKMDGKARLVLSRRRRRCLAYVCSLYSRPAFWRPPPLGRTTWGTLSARTIRRARNCSAKPGKHRTLLAPSCAGSASRFWSMALSSRASKPRTARSAISTRT